MPFLKGIQWRSEKLVAIGVPLTIDDLDKYLPPEEISVLERYINKFEELFKTGGTVSKDGISISSNDLLEPNIVRINDVFFVPAQMWADNITIDSLDGLINISIDEWRLAVPGNDRHVFFQYL
jgi:hypothetical protein